MYNSIYLVSHSICNYERLTEEGKGTLPKLSLKARKTFISAYYFLEYRRCLYKYRRYLCIFRLKIHIFNLKI